MSYGVDKATACTRRDALLDQKASSYAAPQRGSEQCPSVAVGVTAPLIGHGWPKGNPLKALFAQGNALGMQDGEILALKGQKH